MNRNRYYYAPVKFDEFFGLHYSSRFKYFISSFKQPDHVFVTVTT